MNIRLLICLACCVAFVSLTGRVLAQSFPSQNTERNASTDLREIQEEQADLRRELQVLEQETVQVRLRIAGLDQIAKVQRELDQLLERLDQADASDNERQATRLESQIEPLERELNQLREKLEAGRETAEEIDELNELIHRIEQTENTNAASRWARALATTIEKRERLREIQRNLSELDPDADELTREKLEEQTDQLGEQIDEDGELVDMIYEFLEVSEESDETDLEEMATEITDFVRELENQRGLSLEDRDAIPGAGDQSQLVSGEYFITQSWSQERRFRRPYYVQVPKQAENPQRLPVFIFLHGNGGNAKKAMQGFIRNRQKMASRYIMVFAQGYRESWNIVSERSKADDVGFIEAIVLKLASQENVDSDNFSIMGASNGSALINQIAIESKLPNIRNYISGVSPLNEWQYDGEYFKAKGEDNNYKMVSTPMMGKRLMNISGTEDNLVPYEGGPSEVIPAKDGKLAFVSAEESTFIWARQMGYEGEKLTKPTRVSDNIEIFGYLNGDVIHCKVNHEGHGATHAVGEDMLLEFLQGGEAPTP